MIKEKTISFYTLGCRLNQAETAVLQNTFTSYEYRVVNFEDPADIVVINTCTVTENGDADTRKLVNKINRLNPHVQIALIGCQAQIQKQALTELPNVKWVVGNEQKMDLVAIFGKTRLNDPVQVITPAIRKKRFTLPTAGIDLQHTRANLKIQDGCNFFCSFCEIPYARGRARSREFDDIIKEAKILVAAGHKELILTGINLGTYKDHNKTIVDVIKTLNDIPNLKRIRISSIEPTTIPIQMLTLMSKKSKLCRYLHIPLQSASDSILHSMKRKYTIRDFTDFLKMVVDAVPQICIGTDIIVGFPGEDDNQFNATYQYLEAAPIHYFHVFSYSRRKMAKSKDFSNTISAPAIQKRSLLLRTLSQKKRLNFYQSFLGTIQTVLFEQQKEGDWLGLTDNYLRIKVQTHEYLENCFRSVELSDLNTPGMIINGQLIDRKSLP